MFSKTSIALAAASLALSAAAFTPASANYRIRVPPNALAITTSAGNREI